MTICEREQKWTMLMRAAMAGDAAAYCELLESLARALRAMARRGLAHTALGPDEAEDVVQETLLAVHLKRHTWDQSKPVGPWVRAIARNKLTDALRRRGFRIEVPIDDVIEIQLIEEVEDRLHRRDVDHLLDHLNARQRDIVCSISLDGHSIRDTAARLDMTEGAVRVALHRGLKRLAAVYRRVAR